MKWIKYQIVQSTVDNENVFATKKVGYSDANLAIAQGEAYNGQYEIIEDSKPVPPQGIVPTNLSDAVNNESSVNDGVAATPKAVKQAYDKACNHSQSAGTIMAGTFAGQVIANASGQNPSVSCLRNSKLSATEEDPTAEGETVWQYE